MKKNKNETKNKNENENDGVTSVMEFSRVLGCRL